MPLKLPPNDLVPLTHPRLRTKQTTVQLGLVTFRLNERHIPGIDDPVYEKNREVWEEVPRGLALVQAQGTTGGFMSVCFLAGARKFGYSDSPYGFRSEVTSVVGIEKENGECGHVAAFSHMGQRYWVAGSKHVHIVFRSECCDKDLELYEDPMRYRVAKRIAKLWNDQATKLGRAQAEKFHDVLARNQWTGCFEAILSDSQHIVDYQGATEIRFFAASTWGPAAKGLVVDWNESMPVFKSFNLPVAEVSEPMPYPSKEFEAYLDDVARRNNSEGVVVYGKSDAGVVCCMWKEKAYPYVMERVAREAIKRGHIRESLQAVLKRRLGQQKPEVREYFSAWEAERMPWLITFASWLHMTKRWTKDEWALSTRWLTLQHEFGAASEEEIAGATTWTGTGVDSSLKRSSEVVMLVGPPGSGKSTMARTMYGLMQQAGLVPRWINQDESGSRQFFLNNLQRANEDPSSTHLIIDKVNLNWKNRDDYLKLGLVPTVTAVFHHPDGNDAFQKLCVERIVNRGDKHRTLQVTSDEDRQKTEELVVDMLGSFDAPEDSSVAMLDATAPFEDSLKIVWQALAQNTTFSDVPDFATLDVEDALNKARQYEGLLEKYNNIRHQYACVSIQTPKEEVLKHIPAAALTGKNVKDVYHTTLKFFGGEMDPIWFAEVAAQIGKPVPVTVEEVVWDSKGVAIEVSGPFRSANKVPHCTIATAPGIKPFYSNQLLANRGTDPAVQRLTLSGVVLEGQFDLQ